MTHTLGEILAENVATARWHGRIGWLISQPLLSLGAYWGDFVLYPVIAIGVMMAIAWGMFRWAELLTGGVLALPLTAIYLSFLPVDMYHWLPNAYAMQCLPLALALPARNLLIARPGIALPWRIGAMLLIFAGMLAYELFFAMLLAMTMVDAALLYWRPAACPAGLTTRFLKGQGALLLAAAIAYVLFRLAFPSTYDGAMPSWRLWDSIETTALHLVDGSSLSLLIGHQPLRGVSLSGLPAVAMVALGFVLAASRLRLADRGLALFMTAAGLLAALAVTAPISLVGKYIEWCESGVCRYIDNRFSMAGLVIMLTAATFALYGQRYAVRLLMLAVALMAPLTYVVNVKQQQALDYGRRAEDMAKRFVCDNPDPAADARPLAADLAELPVSFHPHFTPDRKVDYWVTYVAHLRATPIWLCP